MTNHHIEAWEHVQPRLFGEVIEVTRKTPWGFKQDDSNIINISLKDFFSTPIQTDTIILHILAGEGETLDTLTSAVEKARQECVQLLVLEHNPKHWNFRYSLTWIEERWPKFQCLDWGRNQLYTSDTFDRLALPLLSNAYVQMHLPYHFISAADEGIDKQHLIYTHTSELPIDFPIPPGHVYWTIGGGLCFESMQADNVNTLFDISLKQCLHAALKTGEPPWKLKRIWPDVDKVSSAPNYKQWRVVKSNGIMPDAITHTPIQALDIINCTIYTSTIDPKHYPHLTQTNNIIEAFTTRDVPKLHLCK